MHTLREKQGTAAAHVSGNCPLYAITFYMLYKISVQHVLHNCFLPCQPSMPTNHENLLNEKPFNQNISPKSYLVDE